MEQLKCPNCNGDSFLDEYRFYVCEFCGGRMMKEGASRVSYRARVSAVGNADSLLQRADLYWEFGQRERARDLYRQALEIDGSIARARERAR